MRFNRRTFLHHAAAASLPLTAGARIPSAEAMPQSATENEPVLLTILHTNDMHGHVWHPGEPQGLVRLATMIKQIRAEMPNVVLLEAGDMIHGTPEEKAFHGHAILDAMNTLDYDVATVGNHEFDWGQSVFRDAHAYAKFPWLSANVVDTQGLPWAGLKPWTVITRGGVRIGVFGVTTPTTVQIEWPRTLEGITFSDPSIAAQKAVDDLRNNEHVDMVIALSHLGFADDKILATKVSGIDLIIGGHSHTRIAKQVWVNNVLIAQTGCYGKALGRIDLLVRPTRGKEPGRILAINGKDDHWWGTNGIPAPRSKTYPQSPLLDLTPDTAEDAVALAAYRPWSDKMRPILEEKLTAATEPLPTLHATTEETAAGNLFADAIRATMKTDIALMSSSQIGPEGLHAGAITVGDLYNLLGSYTRQHIVVARVPGAEIAHLLTTVRSGEKARQYPVHLSGVCIGDNQAITVSDTPLDKKRTYTVASAAHVIQDYFYKKPNVEILADAVDAPVVRDAVITYLRGHTPLTNILPTPRRWLPIAPPQPR